MPDKTKSAESSAMSGREPKTEINLIRGFKATKCVNPIQISASTGCISSAGPSFAGRDPNYIMTDTNRPIAVNELCLQKWGRLMQERSARSTGLASGTRECWYVTNIWVASQHASLFLTKKTRVSCAI
ncbi:hypothetical protein D3C84_120820 [compost metagenome]